VSKLQEYFSTDWSAMTGHDWVGLVITLLVFFGMAYTFYRALKPSRKEELEKVKHQMLED
jgi:hypothetical protein